MFGNASEGYALESGERVTLMKEIAREVNGRAPRWPPAATGTDAAVRLSREMQDLGASALTKSCCQIFWKTDGHG